MTVHWWALTVAIMLVRFKYAVPVRNKDVLADDGNAIKRDFDRTSDRLTAICNETIGGINILGAQF